MRQLLTIVLLAFCGFVAAQRQIVVLDASTLQPIPGVSVRADSLHAMKTDVDGMVAVPERFDSITFSHLKYGSERLAAAEIADTMLMFSRDVSLPEVVVMGVGPDLMRAIRKDHERILNRPRYIAPLNFELAEILDRRGRRDRKHLKRALKIQQEYDLK
ncbi:MAG: carboxypeptidase-like regulatory domain-containing protein [Prevotella sp.]|nr:carboxypeptidase-like regulatory domain-containing protein [Prevotella sp.]